MIGGGDDWQSRVVSGISPSIPVPGGGSVGGASASRARARARARVCRRRPAEDSRKIRTHAMPFDCISDEPSGRKLPVDVDAGDGFGRTRTRTATATCGGFVSEPKVTKCNGGLMRSVGEVGWISQSEKF